MWLEQNAKHKDMFHVNRKKCKKKKMVEKNLRSLILRQHQRANLKTVEVVLGYLIYVKIFARFCFLYGHLYKEL